MKQTLRDTEKNDALKEQAANMARARKAILQSSAASLMGRLGGLAGVIGPDGKIASKRRPSEVCRAAVNKRWDAERAKGNKKVVSITSRSNKRSD